MAAPRPDLRVEALASNHERNGFSCGVDSLDRYLWTQASQDVRRKANGVFILVEPEQPNVILGYYTLCATGLTQGDVPAAARRHVPRYPLVSATLIGRLAVSRARQGERLGAMLLADAVRRAYRSADTVGSSMLVVDALHDRAAAFYEGNGFLRLPDSLRLILPMHAIQQMVET
jgi:GNAT superfamily N-acetyltransferase